jgi:DNA modification methylase
MVAIVLQGDVRTALRALPEKCIQCVVTSPPYFGLRMYLPEGHPDKDKEIGLESSPVEYVAQVTEVFREVRRVLRDDGVVFLNLGDSYATAGGSGKQGISGQRADRTFTAEGSSAKGVPDGLKPKDLIGIPWRVAFALQEDGWWLRQDNIWGKKNCMPEAVKDRTTRAHEYIFMLTKSARYFYDSVAIEEDGVIAAGTKAAKGSVERAKHANGRPPEYKIYTGKRNKRSVWWMSTQPFPGSHFATFPLELPEVCIKAGTSEHGRCSACGAPWIRQVGTREKAEDGRSSGNKQRIPGVDKIPGASHVGRSIPYEAGEVPTLGWLSSCKCPGASPVPCLVLDPFGGSGTVGVVANRLGRDAILVELKPEYVEMAERRIETDEIKRSGK